MTTTGREPAASEQRTESDAEMGSDGVVEDAIEYFSEDVAEEGERRTRFPDPSRDTDGDGVDDDDR